MAAHGFGIRRWARAVAAVSAIGVTALIGAAPAVAAEASAPRWALTVVPTPTNLVPESPRTEVDQLTVDATGGSYRLDVRLQYKSHLTSSLAYNATAQQVEEALNKTLQESASISVVVSEMPAGSTTHVYRVEWAGDAAENSLSTFQAEGVTGESHQLTGGSASISFTTLTKGVSEQRLIVTATNVGSAATNGVVTLSDALPAGLTVTEVEGNAPYSGFGTLECEQSPLPSCKVENPVLPGGMVVMTVRVRVAGGLPASVSDTATVSGGEAAPAERTVALPVGEQPAPFGPAPGSVVASLSDMQAGSHPNVTTVFTMATAEPFTPVTAPKDVRFDLPRGLVGNTVGMPRCSMHGVLEFFVKREACPSDAIVGMATISLALNKEGALKLVTPVFNIAPAPGEPAAFGFNALIVTVRLDTSVLSNGNYGVRVTAPDISEGATLISSSITVWGVPADMNGPGEGKFLGGSFGAPSSTARVPLLTAPQQCSEGLSASMSADAWPDPGVFVPGETVSLSSLSGCEQLRLGSSFTMVPDTLEAGAPAGYHFELNVPQNNAPNGIATPNVKNVSLKLPIGTVVNPSAAVGLQACSATQFYGSHHPTQEPASPAECPRQSQVGTVWIKTPALEEALEGEVYLAEPECEGPCTPQDAEDGKMVKLYVQALSEGEGGIVVKLEGKGHIDQATGQIETVFDNNPQLPFSQFKLKLAGGPRSVLANPRSCGPATSNIDLTPWSTPTTLDSLSNYTFEVNENCFGPQFHPSFKAGMTNIQSGAYGPFTLSFGRGDDDQFLSAITQTMPPGLLGNLSGVTLCKEPEASQGACPSSSLIGHSQVLTGPGADPFLVSGGQVFLTEGYKGAPFGLSIVVPAVAGPYTLSGTTGDGTVVVRAKIIVDPIDAHLTVVSDPLPTSLDGIPLQLKVVNVTIDRPDFTYNPTNCGKLSIGATLSSSERLSANVSSPFQVTNCARLAFKPAFHVTTSGHTSRGGGASLDVKLTYPHVGVGSQANIAKVKVDLPKQLPSRLSTLQKACTAAQFVSNPAGCPAASRVGTAVARTPIIPVPLEGPAYFVSYGGAKFPELVIVLSGYGVTVQLHGETFINKAGITSSTFRQIPDVPIGSFELKLPEGSDSALAANKNLCASVLKMPTAFTAQNGMTIKQSTPIGVTGCVKHVRHERKKTHRKKRK